ncbi:MAG: hypothetical protein NVS2B11_01330 [Acetobacteraceae bacterium]
MAGAIAFDRVTVQFGPYTAVSDTSFEVADGEFVSVVGPTGCGKSTLLNIAAGLLEPTTGEISIYGEPLLGTNRAAGYLFQQDALMPWRSALRNVTAGLEYRRMAKDEARRLGTEWLGRVGLHGHGHRLPHQMSGGMRKRVALAQTMILDPRIILMDEPFSALDVQTRVLMENELLALWTAHRKSVLFITHDLSLLLELADRIAVMYAGRVVEELAAGSLARAEHPYTRGLLGCMPRLSHPQGRLPVMVRDPRWLQA